MRGGNAQDDHTSVTLPFLKGGNRRVKHIMKANTRSITAASLLVVLLAICLWNVLRPANSISSITESPQPSPEQTTHRPNRFRAASTSTALIASPPTAGQGT